MMNWPKNMNEKYQKLDDMKKDIRESLEKTGRRPGTGKDVQGY